jgi:hypothetical protein
MGEMGRREHGGGSHLGEGAAEFPVRGGAPTVGVIGKATGRGVLPVGCFRSRMEEGKRTEAWWRRAASF